MEYDSECMNTGYGGFTFEDPLLEDENEDIHNAIEYSILQSNRAEMTLLEDENEDIHHAVQYSILESNSGEMDFVECSYTEEDEQHSGSIQSSMEHSDESMRQRKKSMTARRGWWKKLFSSLNIFKKCKQCDVTSWESSASESDSNCQIDQVCDVCDEAIVSDGLPLPYWGQTVCHKHFSDGTTMCCCCSRIKVGNMRYINLSDGRKLCSDCHCTAIMDTETWILLIREVHRFYRGLNMKIIEDIPVLLVDIHEINKIGTKLGRKDLPEYPLGVTTYGAGFVVQSVARSYQRGENIHVVKEVRYMQPLYEVTSMLIVYGFPRLAIGATLAHEMMHAWMHIAGFRGLRLEVAEGICEVMAHKWIDWYAFVGDDFLRTTPEQAHFLRNLKEFLKNGIETNYNKIYGGGFRDAKWAIERYGLKYTLFHVVQTGNFPQQQWGN